jgi:class 3 adenylate cyclase
MASTRRLAAILAADVAGYSRLMGADEEGTHERIRAHLCELIDPTIAAHNGRLVRLMTVFGERRTKCRGHQRVLVQARASAQFGHRPSSEFGLQWHRHDICDAP